MPALEADGTMKTESLGQTVARLSSAQKTSKGAPAYSRFVNRRAGRYLAACAYHLGWKPNAVTGLSALWSLAGIMIIVFVRPSVWMGVGVTLCLAIGYALDSADGQLARLRGGGSPVGEWLDHVVDAAKISALHLAVLVSFYRFGAEERELLIPLIWAFVASVMFFVIILNDQVRRTHGTAPAVDASAPAVRSLLVAPTDYGVLLLSFVLLGSHVAFVWVYGLLLIGNIAYLGLGLIKWFRELDALSPKSAQARGGRL